MNYPCKECIVMMVCSEVCHKLDRILPFDQIDHIMIDHTCVDCGGTECFNLHGHDTWLICSTCCSSFLLGTGYGSEMREHSKDGCLIRRYVKSTKDLIPGTHMGTIPISERVSFWRRRYELSV